MNRTVGLAVAVVLSLSLVAVPTLAWQHAGSAPQDTGSLNPAGGQQSPGASSETAGNVTITLDQLGKPGERVLDSTVSFEIVLENPTNGLSSYNIVLELNESSTANATFIGGQHNRGGFADVNVSENGTRIELLVALGNSKYDPADRIAVASVTVATGTPGVLAVDPVPAEGKASGIDNREYNLSADPETTSIIENLDPFPGRETPPRDLTGDGYLEDVRGDGGVGIGDILTLFNNRGSIDRPEFFNFRGEDPDEVGIDDILTLFNERRT